MTIAEAGAGDFYESVQTGRHQGFKAWFSQLFAWPESCAAELCEAGSFLLEFGMLSVLSGQSRFYHSAKRSLVSFWGFLALAMILDPFPS